MSRTIDTIAKKGFQELNTKIKKSNDEITTINEKIETSDNDKNDVKAISGLSILQNSYEGKLRNKYISNGNCLKVSECFVKATQKDLYNMTSTATYNNFLIDGDKVRDVVIRGQSYYKKDEKYYNYRTQDLNKVSYVSLGEEDDNTIKFNYKNWQGTAKDYTVTVTAPLRSVVDTCDELSLLTGKVTRRIKEVTLNGTETWEIKTQSDSHVTFRHPLTDLGKKYPETTSSEDRSKYGSVMCDSVGTNAQYKDNITNISLSFDGKLLYLTVAKTVASTASALKSYLGTNNIKVLYPLMKPTEEEVTIPTGIDWFVGQRTTFEIKGTNTFQSVIDAYIETTADNAIYWYDKMERPSWSGDLSIKNGVVVNRWGTPFQIKGISTHNLCNPNTSITTKESFKTANLYGANAIRLAMYLKYSKNDKYAYLTNKEEIYALEKKLLQYCIDLDMYVDCDFHGLGSINPKDVQQDAIDFYTKIVSDFKGYPNFIFEIFNEPPADCWADIKTYAEAVIPVIRTGFTDHLIIVPTEKADNIWDNMVADPITDQDNIAYCYHLYGGDFVSTGLKYLRGYYLPLFVSEWGVGNATTELKNTADYTKSSRTMEIFEQYKIGNFMWSLNKELLDVYTDGGCHNFVQAKYANQAGGWIEDQLTETGKFITSKWL